MNFFHVPQFLERFYDDKYDDLWQDFNIVEWMITLNGIIVDAKTLPREIQEIAHEKGIILYIHADKAQKTE